MEQIWRKFETRGFDKIFFPNVTEAFKQLIEEDVRAICSQITQPLYD